MGTIKSLTATRFPIPYKVWGTIRVIDSYKVPAVDSHHIYMWGDGMSLPLNIGGFNLICQSRLSVSEALQAHLTQKTQHNRDLFKHYHRGKNRGYKLELHTLWT